MGGYDISEDKEQRKGGVEPLEPIDDLIMEHWSSVVEIDNENNGLVVQTMRGRVKVGRIREKLISIFSDKPISVEDMGLTIKDLNTGEDITPEVIIDGPKYKWVKIPFKYPVERGEEFGFEAKYLQPSTYKAVGEDYYSDTSKHDTKDIMIKIRFPGNVRILDTTGSSIRTSGGIVLDLPEANLPQLTLEDGRPCISWSIKQGKIGYTYTLRWKTEKIGN
jgi:hypothetical protein